MTQALTILAFATLVAFLGVLVFSVPRIDLGAVVAVVLLLAAYDFFVAPRSGGGT